MMLPISGAGVLSTMVLGCVVFGAPLHFVGIRYDREIARRIPPPRFMGHYEYRIWLVLMSLAQVAVLLLVMLASIFAVTILDRHFRGVHVAHPPLPAAFGAFAVGLLVIVLPMLAFGMSFDRRIRRDGPEPPAGPAEVKAFRVYLAVVLSVLVALVAAVSILVGLAGG